MANRYWVGGTASWDATAGTKWATTSGGAGGASVPTSADDVYFDAASGAVTVTVAISRSARNVNFTGFPGTVTGTFGLAVYGSLTLSTSMTYSLTGSLFFWGTGTMVSAGKTVGTIDLVSTSTNLSLGDALTSSGTLTVTAGTFTTNNFNVTATSLSSSNSNIRTINLGSSTVTLSNSGTVVNFGTATNLTFNAGTSQINLTGISSPSLQVDSLGGGLTFYNVSFTGNNATQISLQGRSSIFNNLSFAGRTSAGLTPVILSADQTINGTLTLSAGTNATMRTFVRSDTLGTTRTLTCATVAAPTDIDFRDIAIAGAAAPVSGTRLGDCKGNSGITFGAGANKYWNLAAGGNWSATGWATTGGGTPAVNNFPLAQDTAIFQSTGLNSAATVTVNGAYNIGTIDMSARTSNTMTLATGSQTPTIYGNWINGTGTTLSGTGALTFAGRGSQTITSAGKTFTQPFVVNTPSGSVTLQDAFAGSSTFTITAGTFNANNYNFTLSGNLVSSNSNIRSIAIGSGTWALGNSWNCTTSTNLTVTGSGLISMTSAGAKSFIGGGIQTYPTINQGGTGALTITGSNKFAGITNTAIGSVLFTGGTTNAFGAFNLSGAVGTPLTLGSTNTTQATLKKPSAWLMGLLSTDAGNNTGLTFLATDGTMEYLSVSYINGQVVAGAVHATTGALTGPGSSVLGLAARFRAFDTSGTLVGPGSVVTGDSTRFRAFGTSGTLVGPGSTITGDANRFRAFNTTGDLIGAGSLLSGDARRYRVFDATGEIPGVTAQIVGTAAISVTHDTAGALVGPGSALTGASVLINLYPDPSDVREGVQYGPGGMYVGTLTVVDGQTIIRIRSITERL